MVMISHKDPMQFCDCELEVNILHTVLYFLILRQFTFTVATCIAIVTCDLPIFAQTRSMIPIESGTTQQNSPVGIIVPLRRFRLTVPSCPLFR